MRSRLVAIAFVAAALLAAAPAGAGHWGGGGRFWFGINVGPMWWGPWWGGPYWGRPGWYATVPAADVRTDLTAVDTDVEPEHARVVLNGELIGVADDFDGSPGYLYLKPGHYTVEFTLKGYRPQKVEIDAVAGKYVPIDLKLERIPGEKAAPWYDRPEGLPVSRVFGPKGAQAATPAPAGPDRSLRPETRERPWTGSRAARATGGAALDLKITPANAAVYVDGQLVGTAEELGRLERGIAVAPGKHRIEVAAPGRSSRSLEVDVAEGQRQQVVVELEPGAGQS
jgi:hypothetical protein